MSRRELSYHVSSRLSRVDPRGCGAVGCHSPPQRKGLGRRAPGACGPADCCQTLWTCRTGRLHQRCTRRLEPCRRDITSTSNGASSLWALRFLGRGRVYYCGVRIGVGVWWWVRAVGARFSHRRETGPAVVGHQPSLSCPSGFAQAMPTSALPTIAFSSLTNSGASGSI